MMKNAFHFTLKPPCVRNGYKNGLIRKMRLVSKFMTSQPGKQTVAIHILSNTGLFSDPFLKIQN